MPVRSDGYLGRHRAAPRRLRLTWTRVLGLVLVLIGVVVTLLVLISAAMR